MKLNYKYGAIFLAIYLITSFISTMLLYSWTAFGGGNSMNIIQKIIFFFFKFPSLHIGLKSMWLSFLLNGIFWSTIFIIIMYLYNTIKNKKTAN